MQRASERRYDPQQHPFHPTGRLSMASIALRIVKQAEPDSDYRQWLANRKSPPFCIERTDKRPGDLEIIYRDGEYRLHRYGEAAA